MAEIQTNLRRPLALTVILIALGALDLVGGLAAIAIALNAGWPSVELQGPLLNQLVGLITVCLMAQGLVRLVALPLHAWWTVTLVKRAHLHSAFPVSVRWAWLGWFVPVASHWLPCKTIMALNTRLGRMAWKRNMLIMAWWCTRLLTCTTGLCLTLIGAGVLYGFLIAVGQGRSNLTTNALTVHWLLFTAALSLIAFVLNAVVTTMTYRNQPKTGEIHQADLFQ